MPENKEMGLLIDASTGSTLSVDVPTERVKNEVLTMLTGDDEDLFFGDRDLLFGDDDVTIGRMPVGGTGDVSEFDAMPPLEVDIDTQDDEEVGDVMMGEEVPSVFQSPEEDQFPVFRKALRSFQASESRPKVVRIDTDESYEKFVCEKAVNELSRRMNELRAAVEEHMSDHHGPKVTPLRNWDEIMGVAQTVSDIKAATTPQEAAEALPKVPLELPAYAEGKVKCWRDGDDIVCSIRFSAADGSVRVATMSARPRVDTDEVARWALSSGVSPVTVLGALPDLADSVCGKKLLKDVAGAALRARGRADVCGMDDAEPVLLARPGNPDAAPLAALMHVQQCAEAGDQQAKKELGKLHKVANTEVGKDIVAPLLEEAHTRLSEGKAKKTEKPTFAQLYSNTAMWL